MIPLKESLSRNRRNSMHSVWGLDKHVSFSTSHCKSGKIGLGWWMARTQSISSDRAASECGGSSSSRYADYDHMDDPPLLQFVLGGYAEDATQVI